MANFADTIERIGQGATFTVTRRLPGTTTKGVYSPGSTSTLTVKGVIRPMTGEEVLELPEGMRSAVMAVLYSSTLLFGQTATHDPDRVATGAGDVYEIEKVEDSITLGGFCKAYLSQAVRA